MVPSIVSQQPCLPASEQQQTKIQIRNQVFKLKAGSLLLKVLSVGDKVIEILLSPKTYHKL